MSPYPSQTNLENIVETARILIERDGIENLSLGHVASELGIKAPSLYRYIESKEGLLRAVIEHTYRNLFEEYDAALEKSDEVPAGKLINLARAHYSFSHANPNTYLLSYSIFSYELFTNRSFLFERAISIQQIIKEICGKENSLSALRGLLALVHGYVILEMNGQFRRGGDLALTLEQVVTAYLRGWESPR